MIATGEASIVVAGGAESLSTAPWRVAKPRTVYQTPRFDNQNAAYDQTGDADPHIAAAELLAGELQLTREALDAYALRSHIRAYLAHEAKRFLGEIVPLRIAAEETRDESLDGDLTADDLAEIAAFVEGGRTSPGNTALPHDGAAFAVLVSEKIWRELGEIPGLRLKASVACGVAPGREASAPVEALRKLGERVNGNGLRDFGQFELGETSAAQAIAVRDQLGLEDEQAQSRRRRAGAWPADRSQWRHRRYPVVFTHGAHRTKDFVRHGIAVQGCKGGLGVAAAFEAV